MKSFLKSILVSAIMSLSFIANAYDATVVVSTGPFPLGVISAAVTLNGQTVLTDFWGEAAFTGLTNGIYPYTVTKSCYETRFDTLIINSASTFDYTSIIPRTSFNVAINTTGNGPIGYSGAEVILNGDTLLTDNWGSALFSGVPNGTHSYTITLPCFQTVSGSVTINCDDEISLNPMTPLVISGSTTASICKGDVFVFGTQNLTVAGVYSEVFNTSAFGCDSTVVLTLSIDSVDTQVSVSGLVLTASATGATYQWLDCATTQAIAGETNQSYTVTANGQYAVAISDGNCTDTSDCVTIANIGLEESVFANMTYYPNPVVEIITVDLGTQFENVTTTITSFTGQILDETAFGNTSKLNLNFNNLSAGVYFVKISTIAGHRTIKVLKQ